MAAILKFITSAFNIGVSSEFNRLRKRSIRIINIYSISATVITFPFLIIFFYSKLYFQLWVCIATISTYGFALYAHHKGWYNLAKFIVLLFSYLLLFMGSLLMDADVKVHYFFVVSICPPWLVYTKQDIWKVYTLIAIGFTLFLFAEIYHASFTFLIPYRPAIDDQNLIFVLNLIIFIMIIGILSALIRYYALEHELNNVELKTNLKQTQDLLIERVEIQRKVENTNKELEHSINQLEQLAYASSHDLKMPLRGIISFSQLMKRRYGNQLDDEGNEYLDYIINEGKRQYEQIEGLLNYLRADQKGKLIENISANDILEDVLESLLGLIREKDITIHKMSLPMIECDAGDFRQILYNLLSNSVKFTHPAKNPEISIEYKASKGYHLFSIKDNGMGFDMKYHDQLFTIFKTLSWEDRQRGSGIGLSICKKIVNNYGGKIWAKSEIDQGSTFYFTFPINAST